MNRCQDEGCSGETTNRTVSAGGAHLISPRQINARSRTLLSQGHPHVVNPVQFYQRHTRSTLPTGPSISITVHSVKATQPRGAVSVLQQNHAASAEYRGE